MNAKSKQTSKSINLNRSEIQLATPNTSSKQKVMDGSDLKNMRKAAHLLTTSQLTGSSQSQNRDTSGERSVSLDSLNAKTKNTQKNAGSLKSAEKLQKRVSNTDSQATAATKGINSNFQKSESNIGSGLTTQ